VAEALGLADREVAGERRRAVGHRLDADGNVESVTDGSSSLAGYLAMCEAQGLGRPDVLVD